MRTRSGRSYGGKRPGLSNLRGLAAVAAPYVGKFIANKARSFVKGRLSGATASSAVSTQLDVRTRFKARRGNKKARRAQRRFTGKVQSALMRLDPLRTYTRDDATSVTWAADVQNYTGLTLGAINCTGALALDDLLQCFKDCYTVATVATANKTKLMMRAMCLDVQIRNSDASNTAIVDVYQVVLRKTQQGTLCMSDYYASAWDDQTTVTAASKTNPATTPFQNPNFLTSWRIVRKQEMLIAPGNTVTLQLKTARRKFIDGKNLEICVAGIPGYTCGYFIHARGVPEYNAGAPRLTSGQISIGYQRTYSYAAVPSSLTSEGTHQA